MYVEIARHFKQAMPDVPLYANPSGNVTTENMKPMVPVTDVWCPEQGLLRRQPAVTKAKIRLPFVEPAIFLSSTTLKSRLHGTAKTSKNSITAIPILLTALILHCNKPLEIIPAPDHCKDTTKFKHMQ